MTTTLKCSDYRCLKTTVENFRDDRTFDDRRANKPAKATLRNVLCNVHAGALKRSRYRDDPLPLSPKDKERLLKEQAKVDEQEREAAQQRAIEGDKRDAERHAEMWAFMDLPGGHRLVEADRGQFYTGEPTFEGKVWAGEEPKERWDNRWFNVEPSTRHYGEPRTGERLWPYVIRVTRGASLSPNEARALAAALIEAADKAEELNVPRKPA